MRRSAAPAAAQAERSPPSAAGDDLELAGRLNVTEAETGRGAEIDSRDVMLGEPVQASPRRPGPSEGVAEPGRARRRAPPGSSSPVGRRNRPDLRLQAVTRARRLRLAAPRLRSPRPDGPARPRLRHRCWLAVPTAVPALGLSKGDHAHAAVASGPVRRDGVVGKAKLGFARLLDDDDAAVAPRGLEGLLDDEVGLGQVSRGGAHRPDSARVLSTLMPRNSAEGQPWLTGATWPG